LQRTSEEQVEVIYSVKVDHEIAKTCTYILGWINNLKISRADEESSPPSGQKERQTKS